MLFRSLVLNHLIVLFNVFDDATVPLLFYNLENDLWTYLKSFLIFLNRIPEYPMNSDINRIKGLYVNDVRPLYKRILYDYINCNFNSDNPGDIEFRIHNLLMCYKQGQSEIDKNSYIYYENSNEHTKREMITVIDNTSVDRKSTRLNSSHTDISRMPSSA